MAKIYSVNPLKDFGLKIFQNGYTITPVKPHTKAAYLPGWSTKRNTEEIINKWASNGKAQDSIGLLTKNNPTIDIDVYDADVVDDLIRAISHITKGSLTRVGQAPKMSFIFRTDQPFQKITGTQYRSPDGQLHKIEILGQGQQTVVAGMHPDTKQPFKFIGKNLLQVHSDDLTTLTVDQAEEVLEIFRRLVPKDWTVVHGAEAATREDADDMSKYVPRVEDYDDDHVRDTLELIDPDIGGRDLWRDIGFALWHQYELDLDKGFVIWDEWSAQGALYNEKEMAKLWKSFDYRNCKGSIKTFRSVIAMVKDCEENEESEGTAFDAEGSGLKRIDQYLRRYVFNPIKNRVYDLEGHIPSQIPSGGIAYTAVAIANPRDLDVVGRGNRVPTINIWKGSSDKIMVNGIRHGVGEDPVFDDQGHRWLNSYVPPTFPYTEEEGALTLFHIHMEYLFENKDDLRTMYGWLAHLVQFPEERCKYVPLHIATAHGTGRGWLANFVARMIGVDNYSTAKMDELSGVGSSGQYNSYLQSVACVVQETHASGGDPFKVSDQIRDILVDDILSVNIKFGDKGMQKICTSFLMFSNHYNALHIEPSDRRIWCIRGPEFARPDVYYKALVELNNDSRFLMQAYSFLKRYDLKANGFNPGGTAPDFSGMRQLMIESTASMEDTLMNDLKGMCPFTVFTTKQLASYINLTNEDEVSTKLLATLLGRSPQVLKVPRRINIKGTKYTTWILKNNKDGIGIVKSNRTYLKHLHANEKLLATVEHEGLQEEEEFDPLEMM